MRSKFLVSISVLVILISASLILLLFLQKSPSFDQVLLPEDAPNEAFLETNDRIWNQLNHKSKKADRPLIIFKSREIDKEIPNGYRYFYDAGCQITNCFLTSDENLFTKADVIYLSPQEFKERSSTKMNQITVLRLLESPENTENLRFLNGKINFTASYRWDADFVIPYGKMIRENSMKDIFIPKKPKAIAWFVSNCVTTNNRMNFVKDLRKFIKVDMYGSCSNQLISQKKAESLLRNDYNFYLALENSNCRDYVSEKFFQALRFGSIPIVSGPSLEFYQKIAPSNSFVHVSQFKSIQDLADFLKYALKNPEVLTEFHAWRSNYRFVETKFYCRLCSLLQKSPQKVYDHLDKWYAKETDCVKTKFPPLLLK